MHQLRPIPLVGMGIVCVLSLAIGVSEESAHSATHVSARHLSRMVQRHPAVATLEIEGRISRAIPARQTTHVPDSLTLRRGQASVRTPASLSSVRRSARSSVTDAQQSHLEDVVSAMGVPRNLVPIYQAAGQQYGIPWAVLAAIHKTETDFSVSNCPVSGDGAMGPMQFMPSTFAAYGITAPGQRGQPDIQDVEDAVFTAAHLLSADGFSSNPSAAIYNYNHSMDYVNRIMTLACLQP